MIRAKMVEWRYSRWGSVVLSLDFLISFPVSIILGVVIAKSHPVAAAAAAVLLAFAGVLVALAAIVIAAHTLLVTLISPEYGELLEATKGGLKGVSRPYKVVQLVCAAGALYALAMALSWPAVVDAVGWLRALAFAPAAFLTSWGVLGSAQLVGLGAFHLESRVSLLNVVREVRRLNEDQSRTR